MVKIIDFTPEMKNHLKSLNIEWLEKYFSVEANDELQLNDPQSHLIEKGAKVFYAQYEDKIVGTVCLQRIDEETFELSKMAVTVAFQGRGIGQSMLEHCIDFAKKQGVRKLILYSNTKLEPAISLYRKYGFKTITFDATHYKRANIKMELQL